ncbi:MAG: thiolase family protein [Syntrophomonas sp.]|nr:thiolase family protein [Syntrophomonas sp.]
MDLQRLRNKYAIAGVGFTEQGKVPGRTAISFHVEACANAIKDAGLRNQDIDGVFVYRHFEPLGNDYDFNVFNVAEQLGIRPAFVSQEHYCHRTWLTSAIGLLEAGICNYVIVSYGDNARSGRRKFIHELITETNVAKNDGAAFGDFSQMAKYAMVARRAMKEEGTGPDVWKEIAVAQRRWANLTPRASMYKKPLTYEDYYNDPMLIDPFRGLDAVGNADGGRALIITSTERARDLKAPLVTIRGFAGANVPDMAFRLKNDDEKSAGAVASAKAYQMAGVGPENIDACELYDCFSFTVEHTLRDCGFFKAGESKDWLTAERIGPGGSLPVNTSGGMLSEAYFMGMTGAAESVMQLRGQAGENQLGTVPGTKMPNLILCTDNGAVFNSNLTMIFERS